MVTDGIRAALVRAIGASRLEHGFCAASLSTDISGTDSPVPCASVFPSALVLASLAAVKGVPEIDAFVQGLSNALFAEIGPNGSWNYWRRASADAAREPYPDDLDTTCSALLGISAFAPLDGGLLAKAVMLLMANETVPGGPYRTWLVPPSADAAWKDVDPAVNANIGGFLAKQDVHLEGLETYLERSIQEGRLASPYYPSDIATLYFLSRWYAGPSRDDAVRLLLRHRLPDGSFGTILETAWSLSALSRWSVSADELSASREWLCAQGIGRMSRPEALCVHARSSTAKTYLGAPAVTLAACLEALESVSHPTPATMASVSRPNGAYQDVVASLEARIRSLPDALREPVCSQFNETLRGDRDRQIVLLPFSFARLLPETSREEFSEADLVQLSMANTYGWMAYTIYDDLLDQEGDVAFLPAANFCLRELTDIFVRIFGASSAFRALFHETMDMLEAANSWEVATCRLEKNESGWKIPSSIPDYGNHHVLADRSMGIALGPCAILSGLGYAPTDFAMRAVRSFFRHYIIARQLDDDAHDWEEDLARGHVNAVGARILTAWKARHPEATDIHPAEFPQLRRLFWEDLVDESCRRTLFHCNRAEVALRQAGCIEDPDAFVRLLAPIRASAQKARAERDRTLAFLAKYGVRSPSVA